MFSPIMGSCLAVQHTESTISPSALQKNTDCFVQSTELYGILGLLNKFIIIIIIFIRLWCPGLYPDKDLVYSNSTRDEDHKEY